MKQVINMIYLLVIVFILAVFAYIVFVFFSSIDWNVGKFINDVKNANTQEKTGEVVGKELRCSEKTKNIILGGRIYNCEGRIQEVKGTITISASTDAWDALTSFDVKTVEYHLQFSLTVSEGEGMLRFKFAKDGQMIEQHISPDRPFEFEGLVIARYQVHESLPIELSTETSLKGIQYSSVLQTT